MGGIRAAPQWIVAAVVGGGGAATYGEPGCLGKRLTRPPPSGDDERMGQQLRIRVKQKARLRRKKRLKAKPVRKRAAKA